MAALLHVDAHFVRGEDHTVCEDYALALPRAAVVADGCSASTHTDVGARLIAHAAATDPHGIMRGELGWLEHAERARQTLHLEPSALDCTCAVGVADAHGIGVTIFGDGVVVAQRICGATEVHEVIFDSGAPAYPAYALRPDRSAAYRCAGLGNRRVERRVLGSRTQASTPLEGGGAAVRWQFPRTEYRAVFFGSDGLSAFVTEDLQRVDLGEVAPLLIRIPAPRGAFVRRRLRRLMTREARARNWRPCDDVAVAALCWEQAP